MADHEDAALRRAVELFNAEEYFECHEVLETPWRSAGEPERSFWKGLIHAAVALYQYRRGNSHGARVKAASCRRYLEPYLPEHRGLALQRFLADLEGFTAPLRTQPPGLPPPAPALPWPRLRWSGGRDS
jgi:predicted metal-dependent hydrolase